MNQKKCRREGCDKLIPLDSNGNRAYCPAEDGKEGCYDKAKPIREKNRKITNLELEGRRAALLKTLNDITIGHTIKKVKFDRFKQLFQDHLDLFTQRTLLDSTIFYFEGFEVFKTLDQGDYYVAITKSNK